MMYNLRIRHARQVVLVCTNGERILTGDSMKKLAIIEGTQGGGVSIVVGTAGKIECIDFDEKVDQAYHDRTFEEEIDASGMCVLPGRMNSTTCHIYFLITPPSPPPPKKKYIYTSPGRWYSLKFAPNGDFSLIMNRM